MVKVDIIEEEVKALDLLMKDAKTPIDLGWTLTELKKKIYAAWKKEFEVKQKELAKQLVEGDKDDGRKKDKGTN